jgi:phosphoribosyl 1,2-cyclic phosphate phosphodiesterase
MGLRVTLMGTGGSAGVPHIGGADGRGDWGSCDPNEPRNQRLRSSILMENTATGGTLLVDTAPDMRTQLLANRVRGADAILFTHAHADHIVGLDDVRMLNRIAGRPLDAYGSQATMDELVERFAYAFRPWKPPGFFRPAIVPRTVIPGDMLDVVGLRIAIFDQDHGFIRSLGLRCGGFGYSTDAVGLDETAFAALEGIDTWVVGCFQPHLHHTHAWLERVEEWVARVRPRRTILTHMGNEMDYATLRRTLPTGIEPGYDGMVIALP